MLRECGAIADGQVPKASDINDAFMRVNMMLGQWQRKRRLVSHLIDVYAESTGFSDYTVGPGQQFNIGNRPERIYSGFFRQFPNGLGQDTPGGGGSGGATTYTYNVQVRDHNKTSVVSNIVPFSITVANPGPGQSTGGGGPSQVAQPIDYPLTVLPSYEDYSTITLKSLQSWPQTVFLDTAFPFGQPIATAKFYPVPMQGMFELHLQFAEVLQIFNNLSDTILLPPEYYGALFYNLCVRSRAAYGLAADPVLVSLAKDGLDVLRQSNLQIPKMRLDPSLVRDNRYNIFSDNVDR